MTGKHHYSTIRPVCISRQFFLPSQLSTSRLAKAACACKRVAAENSWWNNLNIAHEDNITTTNATDDTWDKWLWATRSTRHAAFFPQKKYIHVTSHLFAQNAASRPICTSLLWSYQTWFKFRLPKKKKKTDPGDYRIVKKIIKKTQPRKN
jgi:hypothetical protein